jgi:hypothetical protein
MDLVQERTAAHGNLTAQESIIEKRHNGPAQQEILFNLMLR